MILFDPVVEILIGSMAHTLAEFGPDRPRVTVVPVRRHSGRRDAGDRFGGTEERLGAMSRVSLSLTSTNAPEVSLT